MLVAAFFYSRWKIHRIARDIPARLGIQIEQSTEGFTYSKTEQGRTVFTLHAARAIQYRAGGHAILHDVRIQVFNQKDGLADTITGSQFEYDPHAGLVRSVDEARIDLHMPTDASSLASSLKKPWTLHEQSNRMVHVITHGLLFSQKTATATTDGLLEFDLPQGSGQAVGAIYDAHQGQLLLKSDVVIHAHTQNGAATVRAQQALYTQLGSSLRMENAVYSTAAKSASADIVTILLRPDGSAENLNAQGHVLYRTTTGQFVSAHAMVAALDNKSRPQAAHFYGKVRFQAQQAQLHTDASAGEGQFFFTNQGRLKQAVLNQNVKCVQRTPAAMERDISAKHLVLDFLPGREGRSELQQAEATGDAVVHQKLLVMPAPANGAKRTDGNAPEDSTMNAQQLIAKFSRGNQLTELQGAGSTQVRSVSANGDVDTTTGDTLLVLFGPADRKAKNKPQVQKSFSSGGETIRSAVQQGHVILRQIAKGTAGQNKLQKDNSAAFHGSSLATAAMAAYDGATQVLTLTGNPYFQNAQLQISATQMQVNRATGAVVLTGAVRSTLVQVSSGKSTGRESSATHMIADQAILDRLDQTANFTGHARLWQGGSVIEAPAIKILQRQQSLQAAGYEESPVRCSFVSPQPNDSASKPPVPVEVVSQHLQYSDAEHRAHFFAAVRVRMENSQLQAGSADIYFQSSAPAASSDEPSKGQGSIKIPSGMDRMAVARMVIEDHVKLIQPGRTGTGAKIVYTASDGRFVMTGAEDAPPRLVDAVKGSLTGHSLIFYSQQNEIQINGGAGVTTTETRVEK